jgi:hypothetical protein
MEQLRLEQKAGRFQKTSYPIRPSHGFRYELSNPICPYEKWGKKPLPLVFKQCFQILTSKLLGNVKCVELKAWLGDLGQTTASLGEQADALRQRGVLL